MKYILTQQEYDDLTRVKTLKIQEDTQGLQKLCTQIADTMPIVWGWGGSPDLPKPWGCILSKRNGSWYCDQCPVKDICPYPNKRWSK